MSTHRRTLPPPIRAAHRVLDRVAGGENVPDGAVRVALERLGDLKPFTRRELSLGAERSSFRGVHAGF